MAEILDKCPVCGSENIQYGERTFDFGEAWIDVQCESRNCGYRWNEVYKFSHNEDKDTGDEI